MTARERTARTLSDPDTCVDLSRLPSEAWYVLWRSLVVLGMEPDHATLVADATHGVINA